MAPRKISDAEWDQHKNSITSLYLSGSLDDVKNSMLTDHGFDATKAQYIRKLKLWSVKKNSDKTKWTFVARQLEKRKLEGKDSEIYINDELVPHKKVKKETSRYSLPSLRGPQHLSLEPPEGVSICTPAGHNSITSIEYLQIPWIEFQTLIEPQFEFLRSLAINTTGPHFQPFANRPSCEAGCRHDLQRNWVLDQTDFLNNEFNQQIEDSFIFQQGYQPLTGIDPSQLVVAEIQRPTFQKKLNREARLLLSDCLGTKVDPDCPDYVSLVSSTLESITVESRDGELVQSLQQLYGPSRLDAQFQLLRYMVYLSSNNLVSQDHIDRFLSWMIENKAIPALKRLVGLRSVTVELFATALLLSAIRIENVDIVRVILERGIDPNSTGIGFYRTTALGEAIENANCQLVQMLLSAGANPNIQACKWDPMPLQRAVDLKATNKLEVVQLLIGADADVNIDLTSAYGETPLRRAVATGEVDLVQLLLNAGAYVNIRRGSLESPLQVAARFNHTEVVQILLDAGADVNAPAGRLYADTLQAAVKKRRLDLCKTALQYASEKDNIEMVQILLEQGANAKGLLLVGYDDELIIRRRNFDTPVQTPLQSATANDNMILARILLREKIDIDARSYGDTPLQIAAGNGNIKLVKYLLRKGANVNAPPYARYGRSAVQAAAENESCALIQVLVDGGADVNCAAAHTSGMTALQAAASEGDIEAVRMLITFGADVNASAGPEKGRTSLQAAVERGHVEIVQLLLKAGADVNAPAASIHGGLTAIQAAAVSKDIRMAKLLLSLGANVNSPSSEEGDASALYIAVENEDLALTQLLLESNADVNHMYEDLTVIQLAAKNGNAKMVDCLIQAAGVIIAPNAGEYGGWEVLQNAVKSGNTELVKSLIVRCTGADRLGTSKHCGTILVEASYERFAQVEVIDMLISAGADVNQPSDFFHTSLQAAIRNDRHDIAEMLLNAGTNVNGISRSDQKTPLETAISLGKVDLAHKLISLGADINAPAPRAWGKTALQEAVDIQDIRLIRFLLQHGADINAPAAERGGATALQRAVIKGNLRIALILLEAGADINAPAAMEDGRTALDAAAEHGRLDILHLLLKNDGESATLGSRCKEAANLAKKNGYIVITKILREYKNT